MAVCSLKNCYGPNDAGDFEKAKINTEKSEMVIGADIYKKTRGYIWNRIYRKSAIGGTRFNESLYFLEDGLFIEEIIGKLGRCAFTDQILYFYRVNGFGTSNNMSSDKYKQAIYVCNKQLENPIIKQDKGLLSKRISVREQYRIKYMISLSSEKPENYMAILKDERNKLIESKKETWATKSNFLKISQQIMALPLQIGYVYLRLLRYLQERRQHKKKQQWITMFNR